MIVISVCMAFIYPILKVRQIKRIAQKYALKNILGESQAAQVNKRLISSQVYKSHDNYTVFVTFYHPDYDKVVSVVELCAQSRTPQRMVMLRDHRAQLLTRERTLSVICRALDSNLFDYVAQCHAWAYPTTSQTTLDNRPR